MVAATTKTRNPVNTNPRQNWSNAATVTSPWLGTDLSERVGPSLGEVSLIHRKNLRSGAPYFH